MKGKITLFALVCIGLCSSPGFAETYTVTPTDDWTILEQAEAGDVVEVAPGTYGYRVHLDNTGTAENPIVIRAQDPDNRPVWDLIGDENHVVSDAPGSYSAGDLGRGCWQVGPEGAHYEISGIIFRNCRDASSAGVRVVNAGPVKLVNCLFERNTNGLTGASKDLVVEHCEFRDNGKIFEGGNPTHNIYIFGGRFTMRYCYNHDSHEGQLFHVRAAHSRIEYNWLARPASYVGDIMSCEYLCDGNTQYMTLMGNVIIQGSPENLSQILALYDDGDTGMTEMNILLYYNTIIGTPGEPGRTHNLLNLRNDSIDTHATLYNNIIYHVGTVAEVADDALSNWSISGVANWISIGTSAVWLTGSIEGEDPGFTDVSQMNYMLHDTAPARHAADTTLGERPQKEYYLNETTAMAYRVRPSANDPGAFEYGTIGGGISFDGGLPGGDTDLQGTDSRRPDSEDSGLQLGSDMGDDTEHTDDSSSNTDAVSTDIPGSSTDSDTAATETGERTDTQSVSPTEMNSDSPGEGCNCRVTGKNSQYPLFFLLTRLIQ